MTMKSAFDAMVGYKMKQRIITAIIALIIFVPLILYGSWPFILLTYAMASIGMYELYRMRKFERLFIIPMIFTFVTLWLLMIPQSVVQLSFHKEQIVFAFVMLLLIYTVFSKNEFNFDDAGFILLGLIYITIGFYFFMHTRLLGLNYLLFILFIIWTTDTGAYFFGNAFGKRKLWPKISPNKTIEGALGGLLSSIFVAVIFQLVYPFAFSMYYIIGVALIISIVGQLGDLVASAYKRHYDIKDSGSLLPGHGGILDRLDSLLFVLPALYIIQFI